MDGKARAIVWTLFVTAALLGCGGAARAQQGDARLVVTMTAAETGTPLAGGEVVIDGSRGGIADAEGVFRSASLEAGPHTVQVRYLGFAPEQVRVQLAAGRVTDITVALRPQAIPLAEIRVQARREPGMQMLINRGFYARQKNSGATFFTRAQIESWAPHSIAALLRRVPGMQVTGGPFARATLGRASGPASCPIQYFVDGIPVYNFGLWEMSPRDIEGVEVYRGASQVPAEFNRRTARCGVIVIWTRIS